MTPIMFTARLRDDRSLPKMIPWTRKHRQLGPRAIITGYRLSPRDATVAVMPLYHGHGLIASLAPWRPAARCRCHTRAAILHAHLLGRHQSRWSHLVYGGSDAIHQILLERSAKRTVGAQTYCVSSAAAAHRSLPNRASTANRVP